MYPLKRKTNPRKRFLGIKQKTNQGKDFQYEKKSKSNYSRDSVIFRIRRNVYPRLLVGVLQMN
jgi:hypothetical protein